MCSNAVERELTDGEVDELAKKIYPVIRLQASENGRWELSDTDVLRVLDENYSVYPGYGRQLVPIGFAERLTELARIRTRHPGKVYGLFIPLQSEVLSQIPEEYLSQTVAYEVNSQHEDAINDNGYYEVVTTLYAR